MLACVYAKMPFLLLDQFEFPFYGATYGAIIRRVILGDITTNLAYVIIGLTIGQHVVHCLFVKPGMTVFNVLGMGKSL